MIGRLRVGVDAEGHELLPGRQHLDPRHGAVEHVELAGLHLVERRIGAEGQQDLRCAPDAGGGRHAEHFGGDAGQPVGMVAVQHVDVDTDELAAEQAGVGAVALCLRPARDFGLVGAGADRLPALHHRPLARALHGDMRAQHRDRTIAVAMQPQAQFGRILWRSRGAGRRIHSVGARRVDGQGDGLVHGHSSSSYPAKSSFSRSSSLVRQPEMCVSPP